MALQKPTFKVNIGANAKATERKTVFHDLKPDTTTQLRVLPPVTEEGLIFTKVTNHFKLKNEDNYGMALACLEDHGNDETGEDCYLCALVKYLRKTGDKGDIKIANDLRASPRWYLQALVYDSDTGTYFGPKLIGLSKTTAETVNDLLVQQENSGDSFFCDPDEGQDLMITRKGTGLNTKYTVSLTGRKASLDDIFPEWTDKILTDVYAAIELKIQDQDGQKRAAYRTFDDELDWASIEQHVG